MILFLHLPSPMSASKEKRKIIENIKKGKHPTWNYEQDLDENDVIYHNRDQYVYAKKNVIFLVSTEENNVVFESSHWSDNPKSDEEQVKHHITRLFAMLLKDYYKAGVSIQIV